MIFICVLLHTIERSTIEILKRKIYNFHSHRGFYVHNYPLKEDSEHESISRNKSTERKPPKRSRKFIDIRFNAEDREILKKKFSERMEGENERIEKQVDYFKGSKLSQFVLLLYLFENKAQDALEVFDPETSDFRLKSLQYAKLQKA